MTNQEDRAVIAAGIQRYMDRGESFAASARQLGLTAAEAKRIISGSERDQPAAEPKPPAALTTMARKSLRRWAVIHSQRNETIRLAAASGVGVNEIARITGIAKTTVLRILHQ